MTDSDSTLLLRPGLYLVGTPIGNLKDITIRALETLKSCDVIFCEDTRVSLKLLHHYGIQKPLLNYHEHNASKVRPYIIEKLRQGEVVVLISDAGTPLISDPGYKLVRECYENNLYVTVIPGACALISGITLSGLPTDHFVFAGFVNKNDFESLQYNPYSLVFYASPHKIVAELKLMKEYFKDRDVVLARELTKKFEEVRRGSFDDHIEHYTHHPIRGEFVVIIGPKKEPESDVIALDTLLKDLLKTMSLNEAAKIIAKEYGLAKKVVYEKGLALKETTDSMPS